ncbi:uncharacterized protein DNG_06323 [Cephalotrichum gorgonifer]|uniref:Uncharacterized protein n=1 Tax=Cephalotrichum gorgonifer TaxID=2041049 RepID=A0AAE8N2G8_9PEZI|nr:uncharacterized protein DNG_06323 [Cephalotrichum gorgonifer]
MDDQTDLTLRPLIRDILRTRYCIPDSLFLVEVLDELISTRSGRWRAIRLLLGDGELCIQGLLTLDMHRYVDQGDLAAGCLVRLHSFGFWSEEVGNGGEEGGEDGDRVKGKRMVYLAVEDFTVVGWCGEYAKAHSLDKPSRLGLSASSRPAPEFEAERGDKGTAARKRKPTIPRPAEPEVYQTGDPADSDSNSDPDDGFEAPKPADPKELSPLDLDPPIPIPNTLSIPSPRPLPPPVALLRDWTSPHHPLKLTTLSSISHLPYRQNWSINTLAVVASLSALEPSAFPPYSQRIARLADPSTDKRVQLTVFLDAEEFTPRVGSVVLLAGVKNHLFEGGSLKKYVSDRPRNGMPWWIDEPELGWCSERVAELREWWAGQSAGGLEPG